jgi:hypothetical protein
MSFTTIIDIIKRYKESQQKQPQEDSIKITDKICLISKWPIISIFCPSCKIQMENLLICNVHREQ